MALGRRGGAPCVAALRGGVVQEAPRGLRPPRTPITGGPQPRRSQTPLDPCTAARRCPSPQDGRTAAITSHGIAPNHAQLVPECRRPTSAAHAARDDPHDPTPCAELPTPSPGITDLADHPNGHGRERQPRHYGHHQRQLQRPSTRLRHDADATTCDRCVPTSSSPTSPNAHSS